MTDRLSYAIPVLTSTVRPGREEEALVCIGGDTLCPAQEGLYQEPDGRILLDGMEDWWLVWPALQDALDGYESCLWAGAVGRQP
jgi:hypothetical protein